MPKTPLLARVSPFTKSLDDEKTQTRCGGVLGLTLLPALLIWYALYWFNGWFVSRASDVQETRIDPLSFNEYIELDGATASGQTLTCNAHSGCWYTVYTDEEGNLLPCKVSAAAKSLASDELA